MAPHAARVLAFWFGALGLVNVAGALRHPSFDENLWWVDLRWLPGTLVAQVLLAAAGALLVVFALRPPAKGWLRSSVVAAAGLLTVAALLDAVSFYGAWISGRVHPGVPVPLSLVIGACMALIGLTAARGERPAASRRAGLTVTAVVTVLFLAGVPFAQMLFFGTTDYRRAADAIVVFGAKVNPGSRPSISLNDRIATAVELYEQGRAPVIIMSGGIEPNGLDEAEVMRTVAVESGVPAEAVLTDPLGVNTQATIDDTVAMFRERGIRRVLVVSHFYHLPRIELAYQRAGFEVYTVPARFTFVWQTPFIVGREVPAFWSYYLRALLG